MTESSLELPISVGMTLISTERALGAFCQPTIKRLRSVTAMRGANRATYFWEAEIAAKLVAGCLTVESVT